MPSTVHPVLPEGSGPAIDLLGNRVRVAVIRSLLLEGPATRTELASRLGVSQSLLQKHLATLERLDAVDLTPPRRVPGVRPRTYSTDAVRVETAITSLRLALGL